MKPRLVCAGCPGAEAVDDGRSNMVCSRCGNVAHPHGVWDGYPERGDGDELFRRPRPHLGETLAAQCAREALRLQVLQTVPTSTRVPAAMTGRDFLGFAIGVLLALATAWWGGLFA